jgi:hypothetical protein
VVDDKVLTPTMFEAANQGPGLQLKERLSMEIGQASVTSCAELEQDRADTGGEKHARNFRRNC